MRDELTRSDDFRSAQDIHASMRSNGAPAGLTTVYRALQSLADAGSVDMLRTAEGQAVYRECASAKHHHHLVCRSCGTAVEVQGPAVERWADQVTSRHGFSEASHTIELFGICTACRKHRR